MIGPSRCRSATSDPTSASTPSEVLSSLLGFSDDEIGALDMTPSPVHTARRAARRHPARRAPADRQDAAHRTQGRDRPGAAGARRARPGDRLDGRPDLVPPLADTLDVVAALTPRSWTRAGSGSPRRGTSRRPPPPERGTSSTASPPRIRTTRPTSAAPPRTALRRCPTPSDRARGRRVDPAVHRHRVHLPVRRRDRSGAGDRHRRRPAHRGRRRHRRLRHPRPGRSRPRSPT